MARSWSPATKIPSPVKFCRVNHNVTSIHPDRDWQSAYTRVHARLMNLPCPLGACTRARRGCCWHPPGLGHFMTSRDNCNLILLVPAIFVENGKFMEERGNFFSGEEEAREGGWKFRSFFFLVWITFRFFFFFDLRHDRFCISGQTNNGI